MKGICNSKYLTVLGAIALVMCMAASSLFFLTPALADENLDSIQLLFVQNSHDVSVEKDRIILKKISPTTVFFSDRPKRLAGHMTTKDFVDEWSEGDNSFEAVPPNAALSIFGKDEVVDIEVTLMNPRFDKDNLVYDIAILEEDVKPISGQCSLFIDPVGRPASPTSVAGVHRREKRRVRHAVIH